jgi:histidinol-phosphate aminotransferase
MSTPDTLLNTFRPDVLAMHAYHVQDAAGYIKLDAMENPFTLPPALQAQLGERLGQVALNRYPGTRINDLHARPCVPTPMCPLIWAWCWAMALTN